MIELLLEREKNGTYVLTQDGGLVLRSKVAATASEELTRRLADFVEKKKACRARIIEDGEEEVRTYGTPPPPVPAPHVPKPLDPIRMVMKGMGIPISDNMIVLSIYFDVNEYPTPDLARAWARRYGYTVHHMCRRADPYDLSKCVWYMTTCAPRPDGHGYRVRIGDGRYAQVVNPDVAPVEVGRTAAEIEANRQGDALLAVDQGLRARAINGAVLDMPGHE